MKKIIYANAIIKSTKNYAKEYINFYYILYLSCKKLTIDDLTLYLSHILKQLIGGG